MTQTHNSMCVGRSPVHNISKPLRFLSVVQFRSLNGAGLMGLSFSTCRDLVLSPDDVRSLSLRIDSDQGQAKGRQRARRNLKPRENRARISHRSMKRWSLTQAEGLRGEVLVYSARLGSGSDLVAVVDGSEGAEEGWSEIWAFWWRRHFSYH